MAAGTALLLTLGAAGAASAVTRPRVLYDTNAEQPASSVSAYAISAADGSLSQLGAGPFTGASNGSNAVASVLSPDGAYLYTVNAGSDIVDVFSVQGNGTLSHTGTTAAGTPSLAVASLMGIAISPDGSHVYAVGNDGQHPKPCGAPNPPCTANTTTTVVVDFNRDASSGALTLNRITSDNTARAYSNPDELAIAVAPDGKNVFVATYYKDQISNFPVGPLGLGAPTNVSSGAGSGPFGLTLTPSGNALYVADCGACGNPGTTGTKVSYYPLSGGVLGSRVDVASGGDNPAAVAVSPDGSELYVANEGDGTTVDQPNVATFAVHGDGSLATTPTTAADTAATTLPSGGYPQSLVVSPDGRHVYAGNVAGTLGTGNVQVFAVGSAGVLTASSSGATGTVPYLAALVISPNQGPTAALAAPIGAKAEAAIAFDASGSTDAGGSVARYDWDFGDGVTATNAGPTPTHTYHQTGPVTVKVTVTDNEGCSTSLVYTGMSASCNGTAAATTTQTFTLAKPAAPSCAGDVASTRFNTAVDVTLSCSGGGPLTYASSGSGPQQGTVTIAGNKLRYTPNGNASGTDAFTVTATDGYGQSAADTVSISIGAPPAGQPGGTGPASVHYDLHSVRLIVPNGLIRLGPHTRALKIPLQNSIPVTVNGKATAVARDTGEQIASNAIYVPGASTRPLYLTLTRAALARLHRQHDFAINIVLALADPVGDHASVTGHYLLASARKRGH